MWYRLDWVCLAAWSLAGNKYGSLDLWRPVDSVVEVDRHQACFEWRVREIVVVVVGGDLAGGEACSVSAAAVAVTGTELVEAFGEAVAQWEVGRFDSEMEQKPPDSLLVCQWPFDCVHCRRECWKDRLGRQTALDLGVFGFAEVVGFAAAVVVEEGFAAGVVDGDVVVVVVGVVGVVVAAAATAAAAADAAAGSVAAGLAAAAVVAAAAEVVALEVGACFVVAGLGLRLARRRVDWGPVVVVEVQRQHHSPSASPSKQPCSSHSQGAPIPAFAWLAGQCFWRGPFQLRARQAAAGHWPRSLRICRKDLCSAAGSTPVP